MSQIKPEKKSFLSRLGTSKKPKPVETPKRQSRATISEGTKPLQSFQQPRRTVVDTDSLSSYSRRNTEIKVTQSEPILPKMNEPEQKVDVRSTSSPDLIHTEASTTTVDPPNPTTAQPPPSETKDEREKVIEEIWETERQYVTDLEVLVNVYLIPLRDSLKNRGSILPASEIPKIFGNIEQILSVNQEVLTALDISLEKNAVAEKGIQKVLTDISKAYTNNCSNLRVYAEYCTNNPMAIETLNVCGKNPNYQSFEDLTRQSTGRVRLDGFIAKPVQRVLKYPLFFRELVKKTSPEEPCYEYVKKACENLENLAKYINQHKNDKENKEKLVEIESKLSGFKVVGFSLHSAHLQQRKIVEPSRVFIREGKLLKIGPKKKKPDERMFFLFNDMMIYCKDKGSGNYLFKGGFFAHSIVTRDHPENPCAFQLKDMTERRLYTVICKSEYEKNEWYKDLKKTVEESNLKQEKSVQVAKQLLLQEWGTK